MRIWKGGLATLAVAASACTGDVFATPPDASSDASDAAIEASEPADAAPPDAAQEGDSTPEACAPRPFYLDYDGDGYGGTVTVTQCDAPPGAWVTEGGDCDDSNPDVHPNQTAFFTTGYVPTGKTSVSFDYDCDGKETESGSPPKAACQIVALACIGSGYLPVDPSRGAGADDYCGSDSSVACALQNLACKASAPATAPPIACR